MTTRPFPDRPLVRRHWKPWNMEGSVRDAVVIQGDVPEDLCGTLYRVGPNPRYAPLGRMYNVWMGDGMMHAVTIAGGKVHYANRWVRTPKWVAEDRAGRAVFDYVLPEGFPLLATGLEVSRQTPESRGVAQGTCNTSMTVHGGALVAWGEGESTPTLIDPATLETLGPPAWTTALGDSTQPKTTEFGFGGGHPRVCPLTGQVAFFTIAVERPFLSVHIWDPATDALRSVDLDSPYPSYVHDFMITATKAVVVVSPITMSQERVLRGEGFFGWEPGLGTHVAICNRLDADPAVTWIPVEENCYSLHPQNAFDDGERIVFDTPEFPIPPVPMAGLDPKEQFKGLEAQLVRWTIDPGAGTVARERLDDRNIELPRVDDRYQGLAYRYGYNLTAEGDLNDYYFNAVVRYDLAAGTSDIYRATSSTSLCEPVFAPRHDGAGEGDGYLLTIAYRPEENRSDFLILDAHHLDDEPVATVAFPNRVPFTAHGCWAPGVVA